jgi:hypothetical protein
MNFRNLAAVCFLALLSTGAMGQTNFIMGDVTNSATWTGTNLLTGTVKIQSNAIVTIAPGARILMNTAAVLRVEGRLLANGTSNQPITFTRATTTTNWGRLFFVRAQPSRLGYCVIEFANSTGDHQDYYDNDCNTNTPPLPRNYHEAVVALATHLDIEGCTFQNLPYNTGAKDGDAIAIIADDIQFPGAASAHVWNSRFTSIGQGVHTRFSYVLVEYCTFSDKHGDNDDVDLYGESTLPPVVRFNMFLPGHEDKINPTRCSAIIYGNIVNGSDDHGIVLRDKCAPIVFNNLIYNCASAGISVQNQCDALIANNTIFNSARGIRFFDHFDRAGPPYCLFRGSGRATILNCLIWNVTTPLELTDSTNGHSAATIAWSDVRGGQSSLSVSANSTLIWGAGNINANPQCVATNPAGVLNFHLLATSPCNDAGTNVGAFVTNLSVIVSNDFDGMGRPLDGNGNGSAANDIGAYEFLLPTADSNAGGNPDGDPQSTLEEWMADTNPTNALSYFQLTGISKSPSTTVHFLSSTNRLYTLMASTNLAGTNTFVAIPGQTSLPGTGGPQTLTDTNADSARFYRVGVATP